MNKDNEEEDGDNNDEVNYDDDNGNDNDEDKDKRKRHESRVDKGSKTSNSMANLLTEICRGAEEHIPERSPADEPYQGSSDKVARSAHVSNRGSMRQMQVQASDTTSEEDNDDIAQDAANDDDDDPDVASSKKESVDNDLTRMERLFRLYFSLLAKTGTIHTIEEEFNLVTAKLNLVFKRQEFIVSDKDLSKQGNITQVLFCKMEIPVKFQDIWWEEMKLHVQKNR